MAVKLPGNNKLQVGGGARSPDNDRNQNARFVRKILMNGGNWANRNGNYGGIPVRCGGSDCVINHPDFDILLRNHPPYNDYTITFKKRGGKFVAAGRAGGSCGGLGHQQYHSGYPCKTCIPGGAYRTKMCRCEEWAVPKGESIVQLWSPSSTKPVVATATLAESTDSAGFEHFGPRKTTSKLLPVVARAKLSATNQKTPQEVKADFEKCYTAFKSSDYMNPTISKCPRHSPDQQTQGWENAPNCGVHHKQLAKKAKALTEDCAMDSSTIPQSTSSDDKSKEIKEFIEEFEGVFCTQAAMLANSSSSFRDHHCADLVKNCWFEAIGADQKGTYGTQYPNPCMQCGLTRSQCAAESAPTQ